MRGWIALDAVVMADHRVGVHDAAVHFELDNLTVQAIGAVRRVAVAISDKDVILEHGNGIGSAQSRGGLGEYGQRVRGNCLRCSLRERRDAMATKVRAARSKVRKIRILFIFSSPDLEVTTSARQVKSAA